MKRLFGEISVKKMIETEGEFREWLERMFSEKGFKLTMERINIPREKIEELLSLLPHDLDGEVDNYSDIQLIVAIMFLQNKNNPLIKACFKDEQDEKKQCCNLLCKYRSFLR